MPSPCRLHIYDVSTNPEIAQLNQYLTAVGTGAFHGGIEVYDKEFSFGYCKEGPGVFSNKPKGCTMHHFRETIELGECTKSEEEVNTLVEEMKPEYPGPEYDLIRKNCVIFSADFAKRLGVKEVPMWVTNLAGAGATIQDGAMQAATAAQSAAIMAAAKAGEINSKYDISGQAGAKVSEMIGAAGDLDEKYHIKQKAAEAATKGGEMAVKGAHAAHGHAKAAHAKALELDEKYHIKEKGTAAAVQGATMAKDGAQKAIFKVNELAEKHKVKDKLIEIKDQAAHKMHEMDEKHHIHEKMEQNGCGACASCVMQ